MISPIVRKLASDNDIDLSLLSGSGAGGGVITRADVEAGGANFGPETETSHATDQRIPIKGLRKVVADKLSTSRREIPDATTWVDVDATELLAARAEINKSLPDSDKISLMALLARLTIAALAQYPRTELVGRYCSRRDRSTRPHPPGGDRRADTEGIDGTGHSKCGRLSTVELAQALRVTTDLARDGKLEPARLIGGTFTLNNYGGIRGSTDRLRSSITPPRRQFWGIGRIIDKPWVVNGELTVRKVTQISLSFDHRVCDGGAKPADS